MTHQRQSYNRMNPVHFISAFAHLIAGMFSRRPSSPDRTSRARDIAGRLQRTPSGFHMHPDSGLTDSPRSFTRMSVARRTDIRRKRNRARRAMRQHQRRTHGSI